MSPSEWESLCDGCGKCCCIRMEDEDTADIYVTNVVCKLFNSATCQCSDYTNRSARVPDCVQVTPENSGQLKWMPRTCSYRLLAEGKDLPEYHHLVTGDKNTIHERGMSVQDAVISDICCLIRYYGHFVALNNFLQGCKMYLKLTWHI